MAGFTTTIFDPMLNGGAAVAVTASLHEGQPDAAGSAEITGGGYARQSVTWASASGGTVATASPLVFNVPSVATDITHLGLWNSVGEWLCWLVLAVPQPFPTAGTLTVDQSTISLQ